MSFDFFCYHRVATVSQTLFSDEKYGARVTTAFRWSARNHRRLLGSRGRSRARPDVVTDRRLACLSISQSLSEAGPHGAIENQTVLRQVFTISRAIEGPFRNGDDRMTF